VYFAVHYPANRTVLAHDKIVVKSRSFAAFARLLKILPF
jgi:hypothetical protein